MVEDSPSVDAQTCHKRILHKEGLLFVVRVGAGGGVGSGAPREAGGSFRLRLPPVARDIDSPRPGPDCRCCD